MGFHFIWGIKLFMYLHVPTLLHTHLGIGYRYIPLGAGYHCYYTSPRQNQGRMLITMISYECSGI